MPARWCVIVLALLVAACRGGGEASVALDAVAVTEPSAGGPDVPPPRFAAVPLPPIALPSEPPPATSPPPAAAAEAADAARDLAAWDQLQQTLGLPFYPRARLVPSMSRDDARAVRAVLTTDDPIDRVVRFYEQHTGKTAQSTELSDGAIFDLVLARTAEAADEAERGAPALGVQVRPTPSALAGASLSGHTSIILFRRK